jgi:hypothetical protein
MGGGGAQFQFKKATLPVHKHRCNPDGSYTLNTAMVHLYLLLTLAVYTIYLAD